MLCKQSTNLINFCTLHQNVQQGDMDPGVRDTAAIIVLDQTMHVIMWTEHAMCVVQAIGVQGVSWVRS